MTGSRALSEGHGPVPAAPVRNEAIPEDDFGSGSRITSSVRRLVLVLIIIMALVNVTSTVLMLSNWSDSQFQKNGVIGPLLADAFLGEQG